MLGHVEQQHSLYLAAVRRGDRRTCLCPAECAADLENSCAEHSKEADWLSRTQGSGAVLLPQPATALLPCCAALRTRCRAPNRVTSACLWPGCCSAPLLEVLVMLLSSTPCPSGSTPSPRLELASDSKWCATCSGETGTTVVGSWSGWSGLVGNAAALPSTRLERMHFCSPPDHQGWSSTP